MKGEYVSSTEQKFLDAIRNKMIDEGFTEYINYSDEMIRQSCIDGARMLQDDAVNGVEPTEEEPCEIPL